MARAPSPLRDRVRKAFQSGFTRTEIARAEKVTYAAVWRHTKDLEPPQEKRAKLGRPGATLPDGSLRVDAMRQRYDEGATVLEIAKEFQTSYQNAWQVTRGYRRTHPSPEETT